ARLRQRRAGTSRTAPGRAAPPAPAGRRGAGCRVAAGGRAPVAPPPLPPGRPGPGGLPAPGGPGRPGGRGRAPNPARPPRSALGRTAGALAEAVEDLRRLVTNAAGPGR